MAVGLNFRGKIVSQSLPHTGWIQGHCSKKQVGTVQHWCHHPSGQCNTPHNPDD